ncbi:UNVERIFIED_CONTAM: hypothetical protein Sangu_2021600 [Sesamum angustifolium]|uniref:LisH domain-containing protein n=1 Tax=Sesamum angustifolium TaxID=2727405 RepID=A0AAW2LJS3_9LAMI
MADSSPLDVIIEFLRRNKFTKAEAALQSELGNRPDLNGILQKLTLDEKESGTRSSEAANGGIVVEEDRKTKTTRHSGESLKDLSTSSSADASKELIVKEVECGTGRNGSETKWKSCGTIGEQSKVNESVGTTDKNFTFSKDSDDTVLDLYSRKYSMSNGPVTLYQNDGVSADENKFSGFQVPGKTRLKSAESLDSGRVNQKSGEDASFSGEKRMSWPGSVSNVSVRSKHDKSEHMEVNQQRKASMYSMDELDDNSWSRHDVPANPSSEHRKECSVKTVFPFSRGDTSTSHDTAVAVVDKKDGKGNRNSMTLEQQSKSKLMRWGELFSLGRLRLPPVKLKSEAKPFNIHWEEKYERDGPAPKILNADNAYLIGSFLDVPIGQEINSSGKRMAGGSWLSVSQGIAEDTSDLVSGFATIGDGLSESIDYPNEYWDSDEYEDDDDVGYMRQPIEDETWFLAHEIDYPSDNEKGTGHGSVPDPQEMGQNKNDEDDQSFAEEDSYISGEQYFQSKKVDSIVPSDDPVGLSDTEVYRRNNENDLIDKYDGQLMDVEELNLMRAEPVWQGFVTQTNELIMLGDGKVINEHGRPAR